MSDGAELSELLRAVASASGLAPRGDWVIQAQRGLQLIAERRGSTVDALVRDQGRWLSLVTELVPHLTVGETYFFRHPGHFDLLAARLSARLAADPLATGFFVSAGCATGEEPYSIAIALHERIGASALARVRVVASDINAASLDRARAALYGPWAFRDAPEWLRSRYFEHGARRDHQVVKGVRQAVTFEVGHVLTHTATLPDRSADGVLFRNVAIYLTPGVVADVYREFRRVLRPDGLLFVAPADPRPDAAQFVEIGHETTSVYRPRVTTDEPDAPAVARPRPAQPRRSPGVVATRPLPPARAAVRAAKTGSRSERPSVVGVGVVGVGGVVERGVEAEAMRLADLGDLAAASTVLGQRPMAPAGYMIRAQCALAGGEAGAAVEDLRRTLFLRPDHRLARYWYVVALQQSGELEHAIGQARALERLLTEAPGDALLEDGETTARQLLDAARFLREGLP